MNAQIKQCQNCKQEFTIEPDDFAFYEKIKVPPPTFCPRCRMVRRMAIRNERSLYRRPCDLCGKTVISMYPAQSPFIVYCVSCWHSDKWDPLSYGREYDFSRPFFEQFQSLVRIGPRSALFQDFIERSDYTNYAVYLKNCYLVFGGHHYEDCYYADQSFYLKDCFDVDFCKKSEQCYSSLHLKQCSRVHFSIYSEDCTDSWFLFNCRNCHDCVGCTNLRNKSYHIFNQPYSKDEYFKKLEELNLGSHEGIQKITEEFFKESLHYPRKFAFTKNITNSTGDDLEQVKNCHYCFSAFEDEDCRYSFFLPTGAKDDFDCDHVGVGAELCYELMSGFNNNKILFGNRVYGCNDVFYSDNCHGSSKLFGCIGLRNSKEYCILNKQYSKEEYERLIPKIIEHMNSTPYVDSKGRTYRYGEFFPVELSPFAYNETVAQEYFPLTKEQALKQGYVWKEPETRDYQITKRPEDLPDHISDVKDSIFKEVIGCEHEGNCNEQCITAFKIIPQELQFYKKMNLPLPRLCPNCRHYQRLKQRNPLQLWHRQCMCDYEVYENTIKHKHHPDGKCLNEFETSYAPDRKEIVYCEQCYQAEVV